MQTCKLLVFGHTVLDLSVSLCLHGRQFSVLVLNSLWEDFSLYTNNRDNWFSGLKTRDSFIKFHPNVILTPSEGLIKGEYFIAIIVGVI